MALQCLAILGNKNEPLYLCDATLHDTMADTIHDHDDDYFGFSNPVWQKGNQSSNLSIQHEVRTWLTFPSRIAVERHTSNDTLCVGAFPRRSRNCGKNGMDVSLLCWCFLVFPNMISLDDIYFHTFELISHSINFCLCGRMFAFLSWFLSVSFFKYKIPNT